MSGKKQHILIVEDDPTLNEAFSILFTKERFEVTRAFNGKEALEKLKDKKNNIDIVLLDLLMPVMSGLEFLEAFKPQEAGVPVIVFSNLDREKDVDEAMKLGASRYMLKAWGSPKELVHLVRDTLEA